MLAVVDAETIFTPGNVKVLLGQGVAWAILFWLVRFTAMTLKQYIPVWLAEFAVNEEKNRELLRDQLSKERHTQDNIVNAFVLTINENMGKIIECLKQEMDAVELVVKAQSQAQMARIQGVEKALIELTSALRGQKLLSEEQHDA